VRGEVARTLVRRAAVRGPDGCLGFGSFPVGCTPHAGDPASPHFATPDAAHLLLIVLATAAGSAVNSIAGGGTLLTFPALVALGVPGIVANATSTVALVPGSIGAVVGYRAELAGARDWAVRFAVPSLLGGLCGALLLLVTPADRFDDVVPWLVLSATALFIVQRPMMRALKGRAAPGVAGPDPAQRPPTAGILAYQFVVSVYGGYFGAGLGILMLAALGFMGFTNIHRMNGLKSVGGTSANVVAALTFALSGTVHWPLAGAMTIGALVGGYGGSRLAQRVPQDRVRQAIVVIGLGAGFWLLVLRVP
jgi:uncharacterized membrane protein YfcA